MALSTGLSAGAPASGAGFARFAEQRSSACSTMIIVPPGPANTDHVIPATSACARVHRDMSCLVVMCAMSVTPVITASLLWLVGTLRAGLRHAAADACRNRRPQGGFGAASRQSTLDQGVSNGLDRFGRL